MGPTTHPGENEKVGTSSNFTMEKVFSLEKPYLTLYEVFRLPKILHQNWWAIKSPTSQLLLFYHKLLPTILITNIFLLLLQLPHFLLTILQPCFPPVFGMYYSIFIEDEIKFFEYFLTPYSYLSELPQIYFLQEASSDNPSLCSHNTWCPPLPDNLSYREVTVYLLVLSPTRPEVS